MMTPIPNSLSYAKRDKVKDDAIAQLSDQLVSLSARLQEIERKQVAGAPPMTYIWAVI
jgi:hypothetical protein